MKRWIRMCSSGARRLLPLLAAAALPGPAQGATKTWLGNTDASWNTAANWAEGALAPNDTPTFGAAGAGGAALTNDTPAFTSYAGITFSNEASAFILGGNAITLGGDVTVGTGISEERIDFPLTLNASRTFTVKSGTLTLGGSVGQTAASGVTKAGAGALTLRGANTFSGALTINGGTLTVDIGAGGSLGGNAITVNAGTGGGTFNCDNTVAGAPTALSLGALTGNGDHTVQLTRTAPYDTSLTFSSVGAGDDGITVNFVYAGNPGTIGTDSRIVLPGNPYGVTITSRQRFFNGGDFVWYDAGGFVRAINYGVDTNTATCAAGPTFFPSAPHQQITGSISNQGANVSFTTLKINGPQDIAMTAGTLTVTGQASGNCAVLKTGGGTSTIYGSFNLNIQGPGAIRADTADDVLILDAGVSSSGSRTRFVKSGAGTVILKGLSRWGSGITGSTGAPLFINGGALEVGGAGVISNAVGKYAVMTIAYGALFRFNSTAAQEINQPIAGAGGVTASAGTLILTAANSFSGPTTVTNGGTLTVPTGASCANSVLTVADRSTNRLNIVTSGGQWTCGGLTYGAGTASEVFSFSVSPSTNTAPLRVNGDVAFNGTLNVIVASTAPVNAGTYPLIKYTGILSGIPPAVPFALPTGMTASLVNNTANKSLDLNVTLGNLAIWRVGDGEWDVDGADNWKDTAGTPIKYRDTQAVLFDDSASGASPVAVTLSTMVSPDSVTCDNTAKDYVLSGSRVAGGSLFKSGSGTLTLAGSSSFGGGTTVSGGGELIVAGDLTTLASGLVVGLSDSGNRLTITGGGSVSSGTAVIGQTGTAGSNTVTVTGAGSVWSSSGQVVVGGELAAWSGGDYNRLIVTNGGKVVSAGGYVGQITGCQRNLAIVTGAGSIWTNTSTLTVGAGDAYNSLTIADGGKVYVTGGNFDVGPYSGNNNGNNTAVTVTGTNTQLVVTGNGNVQRGPGNALTVDDGGYASFAALTFGNAGGGQNKLTVAGGGMVRCTSFTFAQQDGNGTMIVSNGAVMFNTGAASLSTAGQVGGNSYVVDGPGSVWTNTAVSLNSRNSRLEIRNMGRMYCTTFTIGSGNLADAGNRVVLAGGGALLASGAITVGGAATDNRLTIHGGTLQCDDMAISSGSTLDFLDDSAGPLTAGKGVLYVRTARKSASDVVALIEAGKITLGGAIVTATRFIVTEVTGGPYSGYTAVRLASSTGGAVLTVR